MAISPTFKGTHLASGAASASEGAARGAVIAPELAVLAQNGATVSVASCTAEGDPIVGMGLGCCMTPDGMLRIVLSRGANKRLIEAVTEGRAFAVTFTGTRDHTSFQVKASRAQFCASCPDDRPEIARQATLQCEGLVEIGFPPDQAAGYTAYDPEDLASILLRPERVFSQTPGPGAGAGMTS